MCFYNDYDWCARLVEDTTGPASEKLRCDECRCEIAPGETCRRIYQQEREECQICEDNWSEKFIDRKEMTELLGTADDDWARESLKTLADHEHDYGETCDYYCCEACDKIRRAVAEREKAEGCPADAQQPALYELWDALSEHDDAPKYAAFALSMFPELAGNARLQSLIESDD